MWSTWNFYSFISGTASLEDNLAVSYKSKRTLTIQSSNHAPTFTQ
jgi:hypothetical protein